MRAGWWSVAACALLAVAPVRAEYDVIVVGSGPGGLVAAEYLSRYDSLSVLLLEAGGVSLQASGGTDGPAYARAKGYTQFDIPGEFNNVIYNPDNEEYRLDWITSPYMWLGKLLGGCSSINAALYFRTADSFVDQTRWPFSAEEVNQGFKEIEKRFGHTDVPSSDGKHYLQEAYDIVAKALGSIGYKEKTLNDWKAKNQRQQVYGHAPYAIDKGLRDAPAKTFYSAMKDRTNFKLITNAKVQHIVQSQGQASAVVYEDGKKQLVTAKLTSRGVVVLAAGALNTPQILFHSGIGPEKQLQSMAKMDKFEGIPRNESAWVINDNVGKSVFDTNVVFTTFKHPEMKAFLFKKRPQDAIDQYMKDQSGPWANPGPVLIAYESFEVNGREYDFQVTVLPHGFGDSASLPDALTLSLYVNNPESRDHISYTADGTFKVSTKGTWHMGTAGDTEAMVQYTKKVIAAMEAEGASFIPEMTPEEFVEESRGLVTHHFGGSCYTSSEKDDTKRCADETFRVIGTKNIYVSDASLQKEGTVNPYGFIMYIGHQAGKNIIATAFSSEPTPTPIEGSSNVDGNAQDGSKDDASRAVSPQAASVPIVLVATAATLLLHVLM